MPSPLALDPGTWDIALKGWLASRSRPFQDAVRAHVLLRTAQTGRYLHHAGDDAGGVYCAISGSFGVYAVSEGSGLVMGHIFRSGAWFGQGPMTSGQPRYLSFKALEVSTYLLLPLHAIAQIADIVPDAPRELASLSEYNQTLMTRAISDLLIRRADQRLAAVLLRLLEDIPGQISGPITQSDLSEMANASRQTVNSVLRRFEDEGWITLGYGRITLHDAEALTAFAFG